MGDQAPSRKDLARTPRGFPDRRERQLLVEQELIEKVTEVYRQWGFEGLDTGAFEYADSLGKFLPDQDRPNAGVFALQDDDDSWMALRYDLTAPLARFAAENWQTLPKPFRRYSAGPVWRNEKPGPGRFREFLQCDADTIGAGGPQADAEMIAMAAAALQNAGISSDDFQIRVNTRLLLNGVLNNVGAKDEVGRLRILRALDKLDRLGVAGVADLLGQGRLDDSGDFTQGAGLEAKQVEQVIAFAMARQTTRKDTLEKIAQSVELNDSIRAGLDELTKIERALQALGVSTHVVAFDPSIVRGLEYYTGCVFEAELLSEAQDPDGNSVKVGSIGGGGRYDDLVARFTGQKVPATGFSVGISRLASVLSRADEVSPRTGPVVVLNLDKEDPSHALALASELRSAGLRAETYMGGSGMRAQMKYADRRLAPAVVIAGEDELEKGTVTIKDLKVGAEKAAAISSNEEWREERPGQVEVPRSEIVPTIKEIVIRAAQ